MSDRKHDPHDIDWKEWEFQLSITPNPPNIKEILAHYEREKRNKNDAVYINRNTIVEANSPNNITLSHPTGTRRIQAPNPGQLLHWKSYEAQKDHHSSSPRFVFDSSTVEQPKLDLEHEESEFKITLDEIEDSSMRHYTTTLLNSVNNSVGYDGGCQASSCGKSMKPYLERIDDKLLPIRKQGWFHEGVKKKRKTRHLMVHHPCLLSHTYLQTHPEGVLHVLPGWTRKLLISDLAYRFESAGTTQYRAVIPFLGGLHCTVKTYNCAGVFVCRRCSPDFREKGRHIVVERKDSEVLASADELSPGAEARKKVIGMYRALQAKLKTITGFCQAEVRTLPGGAISRCRGVPVVVASVSKPGTFFTGCTGYTFNENLSPKVRRNGMRNVHYASRIFLEGEMLDFYRDLLSGKVFPSVDEESPCTFVRGKRKSQNRCPRHGCELVHLPCKRLPEDKQSSHTMSIIEPVGYHEDTPDDMKVLYVSCIGEHLHRAPPPVEAAAMKLRVFDYLCTQKKWSSLAQLRNAVAVVLQKVEQSENGPIHLFDGTITIPRAVLQRRLRMLRPPVPKLAVEVGELAMMAADDANLYVRGMKIVGEKYVVFLALDDMLTFASHRIVFAGDATFKTVTEETRCVAEGRWYLYNIVAHASKDRLNGKSVVVMRALVTGLSRGVYSTIWTYFFKNIARGWGWVRGVQDLDTVGVKVPYLEVPPMMASRCCEVSAITMDFDAAEILGCADALVRVCGGSLDLHLLNMFIGCSVHLERDFLRRSRDVKVLESSGITPRELLIQYKQFRDAESPGVAKLRLEKIKTFDGGWVSWLEGNGLASLISKSLSNMSPECRSLGFSDTNVVESQNRRGNVLIGTHNRPGEAALKLWEVDRLDLVRLREGEFNKILIPSGIRKRGDSILRPSGAALLTCGKRRRSRGGLGPVQKRSRKKKQVHEKRATMAESNAGNEGTGSDTLLQQGARGKSELSVERATASAHIDEMRVSAATEEIRLSNRVEQRISALLESVDSLPVGAGKLASTELSAFKESRTCTLIELLSDINDADRSIEKIKKALLRVMRQDDVRKDTEFRNAILVAFKLCMRPLKTTAPAPGEMTERGSNSEGEAEGGSPVENVRSDAERCSRDI